MLPLKRLKYPAAALKATNIETSILSMLYTAIIKAIPKGIKFFNRTALDIKKAAAYISKYSYVRPSFVFFTGFPLAVLL